MSSDSLPPEKTIDIELGMTSNPAMMSAPLQEMKTDNKDSTEAPTNVPVFALIKGEMRRQFDKFWLLLWKNWLLQWRHPLQTLVEILAPVLFSALLVLIRSLVNPEENDPIFFPSFEPFMLDPSNTSYLTTIAYSPSNPHLHTIMNDVKSQLNYSVVLPYDNSDQLEAYFMQETTPLSTLAGIQFDDNLLGDVELPTNLQAAIRFPAELRLVTFSGFGYDTWKTRYIFPLYQIAGPRDPEKPYTADPQYLEEGFLAVQMALANAFLRYFKQDPVTVRMQRFPYPSWIDDVLLQALQSFVSLIIMLSFVYTCISTVKVITTEKEKQLKEAMKIMGLPNWLHWTAWFLKTFVFLLISIILMVVLLKVSWFPNSNGYSVFTLANPFVIFLLLLCYICATITFCFMISVFFSKANTAAAIAGLAWFLSYAPYSFLQQSYGSLSLSTKLATSLFSNSAVAYGLQLMLMYEGSGEGIQWNNIFSPVTTDDTLTLGYLMLMLLLDAVIYLLVALYVEQIFPGTYGVPQPWYYPFTASFWCGAPRYQGVEDYFSVTQAEGEYFEPDPKNLPAGIQIRNLKKAFGNKLAVRDMVLNMYEGQITVLLGHNGAGKTTTMSMLTGMFPPSAGTALVGGFNIRTDMDKVRDSLGLCPQHNVLFDELTVKEHLYFFSKLKGLRGNQIQTEIDKYIDLLELVPKTNAMSSTLSGGMKRKLSVGVALCGNSKVVMLDEPTAGMDPSARRALWDLLQKQKEGRTILLSTHFMDEADLLGDRIAIMAGGQLQCCGSSFFLKKKFGAGYHLIMDKSRDCDTNKVTDLLKKYIPNIVIETNVGSELTYSLNEDQVELFEPMLRDLEEHSNNLGIESYGISLTTLEEVFMKVGADHGQEEELNEKEKNGNLKGNTKHEQAMNLEERQYGFHNSDTTLNIGDNLLTGFGLYKNQITAMLMKKVLSIYRTWNMLLIQIALPVLFLIIAIIISYTYDTSSDPPELKLTLDSYDDPVTVLSGTNKYKSNYMKILNESNQKYIDYVNDDISQRIYNLTIDDVALVRKRYIVGTTFNEDDSVHLWFNNIPYHSPALALQLGISSIFRTALGEEYNIEFSNFPMPLSLASKFDQLSQGNNRGFNVAFNIGFSMAFVSSFYILFYVRERVVKAKHLQFVSGVNGFVFWCVSFVCDILSFFVTSIALMITLVAFQEDGFSTFEDIARILSLLVCFSWCILPVEYLCSYLFEIPSTGFVRMTLISIFTGVAAFLTVQVLGSPGLNLEYVAEKLDWVFLVLPHYAISTGILNLYTTFTTYNLCNSYVEICANQTILLTPEICWTLVCQNLPSTCCDVSLDYYKWETPGIGRNIVFMLLVGAVLFILLLLVEFDIFKRLFNKCSKNMSDRVPDPEDEDDDVKKEKETIRNATKTQLDEYTLAMKDVTKYYKKFLAVHNLCLGIKRYECFGLLGVNGAGKTTTFKMMTGDLPISYGEAWVSGLSLKQDMEKVHKQIGYCPQFDALLDDLTGFETMVMFGLLRGIKLEECKFVAEYLSKEFDFHRHLHKQVKEYSGGNKRKLSTAIALIGDPPVVYLDEPTTGMDPAAKRYLWNALCRVRDSGKCIVLTSHSMEECEALCTRLAIMVNGTFRCLGSTQHLKNKFSEGYTLTIKVKRVGDVLETEPIERFVTAKFPGAVLREKHQELLTYHIKDKSHSWSSMFGIMQRGKAELGIEDYSIGQSSLEQVFLMFTKLQRSEQK